MNCVNPPEVPATAFCRDCGKAMCQDCQRPALGSIYCAEHLPVAAAPPVPPEPPPVYAAPAASPYAAPPPLPQRDLGSHPVLALILGFIPGVGAIYNGQYAK